jgi:hypothetical protein
MRRPDISRIETRPSQGDGKSCKHSNDNRNSDGNICRHDLPPLPLFSKSKEEDMSGFDADQISVLFEGGDITCSIIHK